MEPFLQFAPYLAAMLLLMAGSAFFSSSEAALFYLGRDERERLAQGGTTGRLAAELLTTPERLLTSILFWNLVLNIAYFAVASRIGLALERQGHSREAGIFTVGSILAIILLSEMLPKNLAVLWPVQLSKLVSLPLATATRLLDPLLPSVRAVYHVSLRTLLPGFRREDVLELDDIERAITLSTPDKTLARQEELVLHQIVSLTEVVAEELMRPRREFTFYHAPVSLDDLRARSPQGDYLLIAEPGSEELEMAMPLAQLIDAPPTHLERICHPVPYVPWCASGADTLDLLQSSRGGIAAVVNEHGETIGIVTFDDVLHLLFSNPAVREGARAVVSSIEPAGDRQWKLGGSVTLRRLAKQLKIEPVATKSVTVAGMLQEQLQRLPQVGDEVAWGPCLFEVIDSGQPGVVTVFVTLPTDDSDDRGAEGTDPQEGGR
ncbi:MAG: CNNM domain-containing protein [Aeoliella sp.]